MVIGATPLTHCLLLRERMFQPCAHPRYGSWWRPLSDLSISPLVVGPAAPAEFGGRRAVGAIDPHDATRVDLVEPFFEHLTVAHRRRIVRLSPPDHLGSPVGAEVDLSAVVIDAVHRCPPRLDLFRAFFPQRLCCFREATSLASKICPSRHIPLGRDLLQHFIEQPRGHLGRLQPFPTKPQRPGIGHVILWREHQKK